MCTCVLSYVLVFYQITQPFIWKTGSKHLLLSILPCEPLSLSWFRGEFGSKSAVLHISQFLSVYVNLSVYIPTY